MLESAQRITRRYLMKTLKAFLKAVFELIFPGPPKVQVSVCVERAVINLEDGGTDLNSLKFWEDSANGFSANQWRRILAACNRGESEHPQFADRYYRIRIYAQQKLGQLAPPENVVRT